MQTVGEPEKNGMSRNLEQIDLVEERRVGEVISVRLDISKKEVAPHRKTQALCVDDKQGKQFSSLTNLVVGVTAPAKRCRLFQLRNNNNGGYSQGTLILTFTLGVHL